MSIHNVSNPSNAQNVSKSQVVSDDVAAKTTAALTILHTLYQSIPGGPKLPDMKECTTQDLERVCKRALTALVRREEAKKEEVVRSFRGKCEEVIARKQADARTAKAEYDSISPTLRQTLGMPAFPDTVTIPFSEFMSVFPKTFTSQAVGQKLLDFGFKGNGAARGPKANLHTAIIVPFVAKAPVAPAPTPAVEAEEVVVVASSVAEVPATETSATINDNGDIEITTPEMSGDVVETLEGPCLEDGSFVSQNV
jgi:hypothetical protein